ncbi:sensor histidine kinase [Streptomyces sp. NPDC055078]
MNVFSKISAGSRVCWTWLAAPGPTASGQGSPAVPRRGVGAELVLALVLGLLVAGVEELLDSGGLRLSAAAAGTAVLCLLRRRLPAPVLIVTAGLTAVVASFALPLLVVGWSAGRRVVGAGRALVVFGIGYVVFAGATIVDSWSQNAVWTRQPLGLLALTLIYLVNAMVPGLASRHWSQRRTLLRAVQERNAQLLWEHRMVAGQARLLERQRIAQDMHDSLGHQLALIAVHTGALEVDPELTGRQREAVGVLRSASVSAMHELREVVGILRDGVEVSAPPVDESGRAARGAAGIDSLVSAARAAGNTVELRRAGEPRPLATAADHAAYRIVQEALTNAYKHAPGAPITVELRYEPDSFVVEIVSGAATAASGEVVSGGHGLTGLRERARLVGGMVHAGAVDGGGFRVAGVLPYGAVEAAPFVAGDDDLPRQPPRAVYEDGVPVMDWSVSGRERMVSGPDAHGRTGRIAGAGLGCGVVVAAVALLVAAVGAGAYFLAQAMDGGMIDPDQYEDVRVGSDEAEVRDRLPGGGTFATDGLDDAGPAKPRDSECLVLLSSETGDSFDSEPVYRFCFQGGRLIEKKAYDASDYIDR